MVLKLCETFAFRVYRWSEYRSNSGQPTVFRLAFQLATVARTYEETWQAFKGHLAYWCRDDNFNDEHPGEIRMSGIDGEGSATSCMSMRLPWHRSKVRLRSSLGAN